MDKKMKNLTDDIPAEKLKRCVDSYISHCVSKYGVFSGPYFPVFALNTGK